MMLPRAQSHIIVSLGKSIAQISADFSPIPGFFLVTETLCGIIQICDNVVQNRFSARQLAERCHSFVLALRDSEEKDVNMNINAARNAVHDCLLDIQTRMNGWARLGKLKSLVKQDEISRDIQNCHSNISDCIAKFQLTSQLEILQWQRDFSFNAKLDHAELLESLAEIQSTQEVTNDMLRTLMTMMQTAMGETKKVHAQMQAGLSTNLYHLQRQSGELLPNFNLSSGEVKRVSEFPIRGTATMDIYEGLYLGKEKVSMKAIRSMKADERSLVRFRREGEIWAKVWERDRGKHIVPFYGFCQIDGPFPFMISPWQENGDALTYVKCNDRRIDYPDFLTRIALGVQLLHTFDPPIVHGDIKPANILINDEGHPRLSDFGLSQIINDVSGAPLTQSSVVADSFRYFAPDVCMGTSNLSIMSDVYAFSMTVLEILTHHQPYKQIKRHMEAVVKASEGQKPDRPKEERVIDRGLNDELWDTMLASWSLVPEQRPSVQKFLTALESSAQNLTSQRN